jgi:uncharacterized protein (DUF4415 family)
MKSRRWWATHDPENPPLTDEELKRFRKPTAEERRRHAEAVANFKKKGRPAKVFGKYKSVTIRLHPFVLDWAKAEAKRRGIGYQTFINETLLKHAA